MSLLGCAMSDDLKFLLKQIKLRHYKEGSPQKILAGIFEELVGLRFGRQAWNLIVELLADKLRPMEIKDHGISLLPETKHKELADKFSEELEHYIVAAKEKPWDYLGEVFIENRLDNPRLGQNITPKSIVDMMIKMTFPEEIKKVQTVLDPCVGTGRFLMEASLLNPKAPLILYGVEIDLSLYRACVVNLSMFSNHPFTIICADTLRLDLKLSGCNSPMWLLGNRWEPPDMTPFYVKPPAATAKKFVLSEWVTQSKKAAGLRT